MRSLRAAAVVAVWLFGAAAGCVGATLGAKSGGVLARDVAGALVQYLPIATVGAILAIRRPANPVSWVIFLTGVLSFGVGGLGQAWVAEVTRPGGRDLPAAGFMSAVELLAFAVGIGLLLTFGLLLFPDGRLLSDRWRWATHAAGTGFALLTVGVLATPSLGTQHGLRNPLGIAAWEPLEPFFGVGAGLLLAASGTAAITSLVLRFRRARGVQRLQMRWVTAGAVMLFGYVPLTWLASVLVGSTRAFDVISTAGGTLVITAFAASIGIAVLRYRLYDIDRLVSRTVTYGVLTILVVLPYLLIVTVVTRVVTSDLAVAIATLAAAAAFNPIRLRVQARVDRRFNRARYDAAQTIERFSARLRDEVALEDVTRDLLSVVERTMQPTHVSLWLRA